jgi:hypothetical protein
MHASRSSSIAIPAASIWKALELSTAHLEEQVARGLSANTLTLPTSVKQDEYGYIICVLAHGDRDEDYPSCIRPHLDLARASGCSYLSYDRDAEVIPGFPAWTW